MSKVLVTVELEFDRLTDEAARMLARQLVEGQGFTVTKAAMAPRPKDEGREFTPKAYAPGWAVNVAGRVYVCWSQAEHHKGRRIDLWMVPAERHEGDASVYRFNGSNVARYHGDGVPCRATWETQQTNGVYNRVHVPCSHKSHGLVAA